MHNSSEYSIKRQFLQIVFIYFFVPVFDTKLYHCTVKQNPTQSATTIFWWDRTGIKISRLNKSVGNGLNLYLMHLVDFLCFGWHYHQCVALHVVFTSICFPQYLCLEQCFPTRYMGTPGGTPNLVGGTWSHCCDTEHYFEREGKLFKECFCCKYTYLRVFYQYFQHKAVVF